MAAATSSPELFINVVGTFITEGDLGIGTIVGSAVFNILAVPACCGLFATQARLIIYRNIFFSQIYFFSFQKKRKKEKRKSHFSMIKNLILNF